jgi:hypothetical protein
MPTNFWPNGVCTTAHQLLTTMKTMMMVMMIAMKTMMTKMQQLTTAKHI